MTSISAPVSNNALCCPPPAIYILVFGVERIYALRSVLSRTPIEDTLKLEIPLSAADQMLKLMKVSFRIFTKTLAEAIGSCLNRDVMPMFIRLKHACIQRLYAMDIIYIIEENRQMYSQWQTKWISKKLNDCFDYPSTSTSKSVLGLEPNQNIEIQMLQNIRSPLNFDSLNFSRLCEMHFSREICNEFVVE